MVSSSSKAAAAICCFILSVGLSAAFVAPVPPTCGAPPQPSLTRCRSAPFSDDSSTAHVSSKTSLHRWDPKTARTKTARRGGVETKTALFATKTSAEGAKSLPPRPRALGALNLPTLIGAVTASTLVGVASRSSAPRLFKQHVIGASIGALALLPAAIGAVRSRVDAIKSASDLPAKNRRETLVKHVYAHFYLTYAVAISVAIALGSIVAHKHKMGKAHFVSGHSRVGLLAVALWTGSYVVAQIKVWTPMVKKLRKEGSAGGFTLAPNVLWASNWHKRLGTAASAVSLCAVASGVGTTSWGRGALTPTVRKWILLGIFAVEGYMVLPAMVEFWQKRSKRRRRTKSS